MPNLTFKERLAAGLIALGYVPDPTDRQRRAARIAVEAGASPVVGNHPHVVQAVEAFPTGFVDYALGNFVFDPAATAPSGVVRSVEDPNRSAMPRIVR